MAIYVCVCMCMRPFHPLPETMKETIVYESILMPFAERNSIRRIRARLYRRGYYSARCKDTSDTSTRVSRSRVRTDKPTNKSFVLRWGIVSGNIASRLRGIRRIRLRTRVIICPYISSTFLLGFAYVLEFGLIVRRLSLINRTFLYNKLILAFNRF